MSDTFSTRVRNLRADRNMTLEELGKKIGSSKSYVWELENKPNIRPSAETAYKLAVALGVTVEDLLGEASEVAPDDQVFFRDYKKLKPETKKQIRNILDALKKGD